MKAERYIRVCLRDGKPLSERAAGELVCPRHGVVDCWDTYDTLRRRSLQGTAYRDEAARPEVRAKRAAAARAARARKHRRAKRVA